MLGKQIRCLLLTLFILFFIITCKNLIEPYELIYRDIPHNCSEIDGSLTDSVPSSECYEYKFCLDKTEGEPCSTGTNEGICQHPDGDTTKLFCYIHGSEYMEQIISEQSSTMGDYIPQGNNKFVIVNGESNFTYSPYCEDNVDYGSYSEDWCDSNPTGNCLCDNDMWQTYRYSSKMNDNLNEGTFYDMHSNLFPDKSLRYTIVKLPETVTPPPYRVLENSDIVDDIGIIIPFDEYPDKNYKAYEAVYVDLPLYNDYILGSDNSLTGSDFFAEECIDGIPRLQNDNCECSGNTYKENPELTNTICTPCSDGTESIDGECSDCNENLKTVNEDGTCSRCVDETFYFDGECINTSENEHPVLLNHPVLPNNNIVTIPTWSNKNGSRNDIYNSIISLDNLHEFSQDIYSDSIIETEPTIKPDTSHTYETTDTYNMFTNELCRNLSLNECELFSQCKLYDNMCLLNIDNIENVHTHECSDDIYIPSIPYDRDKNYSNTLIFTNESSNETCNYTSNKTGYTIPALGARTNESNFNQNSSCVYEEGSFYSGEVKGYCNNDSMIITGCVDDLYMNSMSLPVKNHEGKDNSLFESRCRELCEKNESLCSSSRVVYTITPEDSRYSDQPGYSQQPGCYLTKGYCESTDSCYYIEQNDNSPLNTDDSTFRCCQNDTYIKYDPNVDDYTCSSSSTGEIIINGSNIVTGSCADYNYRSVYNENRDVIDCVGGENCGSYYNYDGTCYTDCSNAGDTIGIYEGVCTDCAEENLYLVGSECIESCPGGTYAHDNSCHESCDYTPGLYSYQDPENNALSCVSRDECEGLSGYVANSINNMCIPISDGCGVGYYESDSSTCVENCSSLSNIGPYYNIEAGTTTGDNNIVGYNDGLVYRKLTSNSDDDSLRDNISLFGYGNDGTGVCKPQSSILNVKFEIDNSDTTNIKLNIICEDPDNIIKNVTSMYSYTGANIITPFFNSVQLGSNTIIYDSDNTPVSETPVSETYIINNSHIISDIAENYDFGYNRLTIFDGLILQKNPQDLSQDSTNKTLCSFTVTPEQFNKSLRHNFDLIKLNLAGETNQDQFGGQKVIWKIENIVFDLNSLVSEGDTCDGTTDSEEYGEYTAGLINHLRNIYSSDSSTYVYRDIIDNMDSQIITTNICDREGMGSLTGNILQEHIGQNNIDDSQLNESQLNELDTYITNLYGHIGYYILETLPNVDPVVIPVRVNYETINERGTYLIYQTGCPYDLNNDRTFDVDEFDEYMNNSFTGVSDNLDITNSIKNLSRINMNYDIACNFTEDLPEETCRCSNGVGSSDLENCLNPYASDYCTSCNDGYQLNSENNTCELL